MDSSPTSEIFRAKLIEFSNMDKLSTWRVFGHAKGGYSTRAAAVKKNRKCFIMNSFTYFPVSCEFTSVCRFLSGAMTFTSESGWWRNVQLGKLHRMAYFPLLRYFDVLDSNRYIQRRSRYLMSFQVMTAAGKIINKSLYLHKNFFLIPSS